MSEAAEKLAELGAGHDAFELIEFIRLHNTMADPETEHEGSAAVIEVTTLVSRLAITDVTERSGYTADGGHPCASSRC